MNSLRCTKRINKSQIRIDHEVNQSEINYFLMLNIMSVDPRDIKIITM